MQGGVTRLRLDVDSMRLWSRSGDGILSFGLRNTALFVCRLEGNALVARRHSGHRCTKDFT